MCVKEFSPTGGNTKILNVERTKLYLSLSQKLDCKTVRIFLRIQVRPSSQTKGLERG